MSDSLRDETAMRVCMIGAHDETCPRYNIMKTGLEQAGVEVTPIILPRGQSAMSLLPHIIRQWGVIGQHDLVIIAPFTQLLAPFIWLLSTLRRKPVLLDYMVGLTDGSTAGRGMVSPLKAAMFWLVDQFNARWISTVTDTVAHRHVFQRLLRGKLPRMQVVPVGAYDPWFNPRPLPADDQVLVLFYGTYIPFHGVDTILDAIHLLKDEPRLQFELIGRGQTYQAAMQKVEALQLENITFVDMVYPPDLPAYVERATICLGVFGADEKTDYVVPNKVFQCLAMGRPVITAASTALNEYFVPGEHLLTVAPGDAQQLAQAIKRLAVADNCLQVV